MKHSRIMMTLQERFGDPIGSYAGDAPVGVRSEAVVCPSCGMMPIDGVCGCAADSHDCGCGAPVGECSCEEELCDSCGMSVDQCACPASGTCPKCGMMPIDGECNCALAVMEAAGSCAECGMSEAMCECGTYESDMKEVAPPGHEKMVKGLKKDPDIDNPWAVAWSAYNKKKKKGER